MIAASICEIIVGIVFGVVDGGMSNIILWVLLFVGIVTGLSVLVEYSQDIVLKESKIEFYKFNDLVKSIKYSSIKSIYISKGDEPRTKKKDFLAIGYIESDKKGKNAYLINLMNYGVRDLANMKNTIISKNSVIEVSDEVKNMIK